MWVYILSEKNQWEVGFYDPKGKWERDLAYSRLTDAAERVHYLNGGN